jgi:N-acetylglucosamine-6-sulfatase
VKRLAALLLLAIFTAFAVMAPANGQAAPAPEPTASPEADEVPVQQRMNVLFVLSDDQTMYSQSAMKYLNSQPYGNWVRFDNAFLSTPLCCPTRATILTGQHSYRTGVVKNDGRPFDDSQSLATWLQDAGYRTGFVGKYFNLVRLDKGDTYVPPGWDRWSSMLTMAYTDFLLNQDGQIAQYSGPDQYLTDVLSDQAIGFIEQNGSQPWFLWLAYRAPHKPTTPAPRHADAKVQMGLELPSNFNEKDRGDKPQWVRRLPKVDRRKMLREYRQEYRTMLAVDEGLRGIMETLLQTGQLDRTVIIYMTDNGYARGQHSWHGKKCAYEECIRTPFLVRFPGVQSRTEEGFVSSIDIAPTVMNIAGATAGLPQDGTSLVPLLKGAATDWRKDVLINLRYDGGVPAWWGIRNERWKLVELSTGERELYDLQADPYELHNLAAETGYQELIAELQERIEVLRQ